MRPPDRQQRGARLWASFFSPTSWRHVRKRDPALTLEGWRPAPMQLHWLASPDDERERRDYSRIRKLALWEPPFILDDSRARPPADTAPSASPLPSRTARHAGALIADGGLSVSLLRAQRAFPYMEVENKRQANRR